MVVIKSNHQPWAYDNRIKECVNIRYYRFYLFLLHNRIKSFFLSDRVTKSDTI